MEPMELRGIARALGCPWEGGEIITTVTTDSRDVPPGSLFVALTGDRFDGHDYVGAALEKGAAAAVICRDCAGDAARLLRVEDTRDALIAIGGLYRSMFSLRCVGITGSVGKTTTKEMIAAVVASAYKTLKTEGNLNNEIGMPQTLFRLTPGIEAAVIEMGMQGLGEIAKLAAAAKPDIGVITNVGVSHMELLGSRENILRAKLELAQALPDGAPLILCGDNDLLSTVRMPRLDVRFYGIDAPGCGTWAEGIRDNGHEITFTLRTAGQAAPVRLPCTGRHNLENALAACCVGQALGIPPEICAGALERYAPAGMRQRIVPWNGMTVVEDCYNASPDSMRAALETLGAYPGATRRIAVLSDMLELGKISKQAHYDVGAFAAQNRVDLLLAYGEESCMYVEGALQKGLEAHHFPNGEALLETLKERLCPGCVIWVKGSHGMHMETLLETLYQSKGGTAG